MTKDEAKEFLREFLKDRPNFREEHPGQDEEVYRQMDRLTEALDMAIEALGKDTDVPSSDLINRKDFDKCLEDAEKEAVRNRKYVFASALNTIRGNLRNFPSAQPERKMGKWIEDAKTYYEQLNERGLRVDEYTPYFTDDIACSVCLAKYSTIDNETQFFKFCPNCGAKMEAET